MPSLISPLRGLSLVAAFVLSIGVLRAQLPEGPGREETEKMCSACHELERSLAPRQDRDGWKTTMNKMVSLGAESTDAEFTAVLEYLAAHYPAAAMPPLNVNTARAIDFESRLTLRRSQSAAIIEYRTKHGGFQSVDDLKKVPGIDPERIEAKKAILVF